MPDITKHKNELIENGYTIIDTPFLNDQLDFIRNEFYRVNSIAYKNLGGKDITSDADIIAFNKDFSGDQYNVWKVFQFSPYLYGISGHPQLVKLLQDIGLTTPTLDLAPQLRCDMPIEGQSIFMKHQDYSYNIGSEDAVTVWSPLQDTGIKEGALLVVPQSHQDGVYKHTNGIISDEYEFAFINEEIKFGQSLIFHQKLVHQSGFNSSDKIRFSLQVRYSNLEASEYLERQWYKNHKSVIQKFA